jgi:hypothetical protein
MRGLPRSMSKKFDEGADPLDTKRRTPFRIVAFEQFEGTAISDAGDSGRVIALFRRSKVSNRRQSDADHHKRQNREGQGTKCAAVGIAG